MGYPDIGDRNNRPITWLDNLSETCYRAENEIESSALATFIFMLAPGLHPSYRILPKTNFVGFCEASKYGMTQEERKRFNQFVVSDHLSHNGPDELWSATRTPSEIEFRHLLSAGYLFLKKLFSSSATTQ